MHFYAEHNRYGIGCTTTTRIHGREIVISAGNLYRFTTRAERDAWVADDRHRTALTAAEARKDHATGKLSSAYWEDANFLAIGATDDAGFDRFIEPERE